MFTPKTLTFLRQLKRNNDRPWFAEHRDVYEREVKARTVAFVERIAEDFRRVAPDILATPKASLFRIYRDTRFASDKSPFKTQVGMVFPHKDLHRNSCACLYVEIGPDGTLVAGGLYAPEPPQLLVVRQHVAVHLNRFRTIVEAPAFIRAAGRLQGESLARVPRGFSADHPGAEYLKMRQYLCWREYPAAFAADAGFYREVVTRFKAMLPLVRFLNEPLLALAASRDPLDFTLDRPRPRPRR